jgi:ATP-binding cassette subfamily B protein
VEREAERKAFNRAWRYLNYNSGAKWSALLAGVGIGLLYVSLLVVLFLFADLMVHRGQVPGYRELSRPDQEKFRDHWNGPTGEGQDPQVLAQKAAERQDQLADIGLDPATVGQWKDIVVTADKDPVFQSVLWRAYLFRLLRDQVGGTAASLILPAYRDLPPPQQKIFGDFWDGKLPEKQQKECDQFWLTKQDADKLSAAAADQQVAQRRLILLTAGDLDESDRNKLSKVDFAQLAGDQELAWRCHEALVLDLWAAKGDADSWRYNGAADYYRSRLIKPLVGDGHLVETEATNLEDRGILSLVVRTHLRNNLHGEGGGWLAAVNPYRVTSSVQGWLARWNPWMWKYGSPTRPTFFYYLTGLLVVALVLAALRALLGFALNLEAARATIEAASRLRRSVYHHTFRLGTLVVRALGPGEAVTIFTRHVESLHDALYTWLTVLFPQPIKFGLLLALALIIHPLLAVAFLLFAVLVWLVGGQVAAYFRQQGRTATTNAAEQLTLIRESLMLMRLVKCYLMELFNQSRVERQLARLSAAQMRRYRGEAIYKPLLMFLGLLAAVVLLYVAGLIVLHGQLEVASTITLATALVSLYWPLTSLLEHRRLVRRGKESAVAIFQFLDRPGDVGQVVGAEFLPPLSKQMEFDNVTLREPGSNRVLLQDVSLTIKAGQRVALVGSDDMEKHALVYLIPRFLDPSSGEIRIDDHNLRWVTLDSLRAQIAVVLQHNLVFHDTVANNIGCGDPAFTLPQIIEAAKMAHAHHFIQRLPRGYETPIGELGHSLSISEQFRIALARAILRDPALLIVEEPETDLDDDTKALLDDTFARLLPGRTAIFLPHRLSTIRSCDRIFLVHKGRLEAAGDHRHLLSQNQLYRHLHYLEFSEMAEQV